MPQVIDRVSPVPYYEQLFRIFRDRIASGEVRPDERLPSELELCRDFGLSRATVRQTLAKLESEGLAHRVPRRGVFASPPGRSTGWTVQEGFLESQLRHGRTGITTRVVAADFVDPPAHVAERLGLAAGAKVFALSRLRSLEGTPAMFSTNWFPAAVGGVISASTDVLSGEASLNAALDRAGFVTSGAQRVIRAMSAPDDVANQLDIDPGAPILQVRSLSWDQLDVRFDFYETWVLTDVIPLEVNVAAT